MRYTFLAEFGAMSDISAQIEIPKRALFKAAEVCDLIKVQPYVLRTWEAEFPALGVAKASGGPRIYRRADVEQVVRIKDLLLVEGLTLAGARRRLEEEGTPVASDASLDELIGQNARERLTAVKRGLRSILELLSGVNGGETLRFAAPRALSNARRTPVGRVKLPRGKRAARSRGRPARASAARRKRSA